MPKTESSDKKPTLLTGIANAPGFADSTDSSAEFRCYSARDVDEGEGLLVFNSFGVYAIPAPENTWRAASQGAFADPSKPRSSEGSWKPWFLFTRAFILSLDSRLAANLELASADSEKEALQQLHDAAKAKSAASEARKFVVLQALAADPDFPVEIASTDELFIDWFSAVVTGKLRSGDLDFIERLLEFAKIVRRLPTKMPAEISDLCRAVATAAAKVDGVPTKGQVTVEMRQINLNYADERVMREFRKRAGFQWLPKGKSGPRSN